MATPRRLIVLVKTLIFTVVVPGSVSVLFLWLLLSSGWELWAFAPGWWRILGLLSMAVGVSIYLWCAWDFATHGGGTAAPIDPPKMLVARGLYRAVRNPMCVGVTTILVGEALTLGSITLAVFAAAVWSLFHLFVVCCEEPHLRRTFTVGYEAYCGGVPRWVPMARRGSAAK